MKNDFRTVSYTDEELPAAEVSGEAMWLWLDPARHPGCEVNPTTVFAGAPEGFAFFAAEFEKTVVRRTSLPGILRVNIFADPRFRLSVNGEVIGTGPIAAGGDYANTLPMPKQYVDHYEIPVEGRTVKISAEVWNGCAVMTDYSVGRCGFVFSGEIDGVPVLSDESWRVRLLPGWKSVCEFDAAVPPGEWETPAVLEEIPWNPADPCLPPLSEEAVLPETIRRDEFAGENVIRASFERIYSAYVCLSVVNGTDRPASVRFGAGEYMPENPGTGVLTVPPASSAEFRCLRMHSVGAVLVRAPFGVEANVSLIYAHYPVDRANEGYFRCSDEMLTKIYDLGKNTLEMCRQSLHLDSPLHQETLGCTGDYAIEALMTRMTFGDMRLTRLDLLRTADYLVMTDGYMFHTTYSLVWVSMLRDYLRWTGDKTTARACLPALRILFRRFRGYFGERGVIENPPNYMFVDWGEIDGFQLHHPPMALGQTVLNAFWQNALIAASQICRSLGETKTARSLKDEAERHRGACVREFYDFEKEIFSDGWPRSVKAVEGEGWQPENPDKRYYTRHANALAVLFGLARGKTAKALGERVLVEEWLERDSYVEVQPYFMHYLFEMAAKTGLLEKYALGMLHLWDKQVNDSPKGLKEGWGLFHGDCSHAWGGTPTYQLPLRFSGFEMKKPGFREFSVDPDLHGLEWAEIGIPTPWGLLTIRADGNGVSVDAPEVFEIARGPKGKGFVIHRKAD
ncbi:MAG: hypothetical protein IIU08_09665 [Clostridia bacterium]|nr:hypothetical protein [Clostridia bacterium]